jgi:ferric iron reductase protein FhuF
MLKKKTPPKNRTFTSLFWAYMKSRSQVLCSNMQGIQQAKSMEWQNDGKILIYYLSEMEPRLNSEENRKYQLLPNDRI